MKYLHLYLGLFGVSATLGGCVDRAAQKQAKDTAAIVTSPIQTVAVKPVWTQTLTRNLDITGEVTTSNDSNVGAKTAGKLVAVYVKDGDKVKSGQVLARQDSTPLIASLNQAQAQVLTAQAGLASANSQLTQAIRNQQFNPYRTTASVSSARAALRSAQANLDKMVAGARPQERSQAQATLNSAKANLDVQKKQLDRITTLVQQGALAGSQQDTQEATYESALATYQNAKDALTLIQIGNRPEDIAAAKEQVTQANEALKTAQATKSLDPLYNDQVTAARASVESARATIQNAQAQVVIATQSLDDAVIRAPFDGQVSGKPAEVGTIATPGSTVLRVIGDQGIYFEGNVPSDAIGEIQLAMPVKVTVDAVSDSSIQATVAAISPLASAAGRLFNVRVQFKGAPTGIRPGMFATGDVQVQSIPGATVVPADALITQNGQSFVYLAENGVAKKTVVHSGLQQGEVTQVTGLKVGDPVIYQGQDRLTDGAKVTVAQGVKMTSNSPENTSKAQG